MNVSPFHLPNSEKPRTIFDRAAIHGLWLGVYFILLFLFAVGSMRWGILNLIVLGMVLFVPFVIFSQLRQTHKAAHGLETMPALWMQGIVTFGCGALIFCAASYVFMRWIYPDFMVDTLKMASEFYDDQPGPAAGEIADELQMMIERKVYPTASSVSVMWLWLITFSGSVLSLIEAIIVKMIKVK